MGAEHSSSVSSITKRYFASLASDARAADPAAGIDPGWPSCGQAYATEVAGQGA
jgi:hypothetical protein